MSEVTRTIFLLNEERIRAVSYVICTNTDLPLKFCRIIAKVNERAALIHVDAGSHIWITVPEELLVRAVEDIAPQRAFGLCIVLLAAVIVSELSHRHICELAFLLKLSIIRHAVFI